MHILFEHFGSQTAYSTAIDPVAALAPVLIALCLVH